MGRGARLRKEGTKIIIWTKKKKKNKKKKQNKKKIIDETNQLLQMSYALFPFAQTGDPK